jgi:small conductance mechanosensitive channel
MHGQDIEVEKRVDPAFASLILEPLEFFGVDNFGDSAVVIKARFKTKPIEQGNVGLEYRRRLKNAFDEQGIEIPFPHQTLYWGEASRAMEVLVTSASSG